MSLTIVSMLKFNHSIQDKSLIYILINVEKDTFELKCNRILIELNLNLNVSRLR